MFPIPRLAGILSAIALVALLWGHGWKTGWDQRSDRADKAQAVAERVQAQVFKRRVEIKEVAVYQYVDRWRTVLQKGATIVKEVPVYVTAKADAQCAFTNGFVSVLNAASRGESMRAFTGDFDETAAGLRASDVARSVAGNYTTCRAVREQLIAIQDVARQLYAP